MRTSATIVRLTGISAALMLILTFSTLPFPADKTPQLLAKANLYNLQFPQEKVYLHTDRSSYWGSEDIWFKAYLEDSPIADCNLYVELLNSSGAVIEKRICWAQHGLAYGDFHLADTISTGVYQLRAYTNWMRNFDEWWFFRKDIVIMNLRDKLPPDESDRLRERKIDVQFFPEGGTFVTSLKSKVAFKVADQNGKGLDADGKIVDDLGNEILRFKSNFKGIGHFNLQPKEGRKYLAEITVAGIIGMNIDLPVPEPEGITLAIDLHDTTQIAIQISKKSMASTENFTSEYTLVGKTKGGVFYRKNIAMELNVFNLSIEKDQLPNGIIQFTLFDPEAIPLCERLVFIKHNDFIRIEIKPGKPTYLPREMVQLDLDARTAEGVPCWANLSMSVVNMDVQFKTEDYPNNILTHFLLGSELKGLIEEPGYYFKDDSLSTAEALDNLMLSHGYRHFEWKEISEDRFPKITYPAEECIQVRGTVKSIVLEKPIPNCSVTMMTVKSLLSVKEQKTDSLGQFLFSDLYFNDTISVSLQALNPKGRKNTVIELDNRSSISPIANYLPFTYQYSKENPTKTISYMDEENENIINRKWHLSDTILLNDIKIRGYKQKKMDGIARPYLEADYVIDVTKMDNVYSNILETLESNSMIFRSFSAKGPGMFLDGVFDRYGIIENTPASWIEKVEFVKMASLPGVGFGPAIFFYTKRGAPNEKAEVAIGMKPVTLVGYSIIRQFYSPKYETQLPTEMKNDYRSTLYWNPIVRTDSLGRAGVSFYNSDQAGEVQIEVEGITSDGKLCRGVGNYKVTH
ncbi:MAG TPA: hypothetical protein VGK10_11045 [Prolixibacteraceae bacterium]|jgi:hypothetical protein